MALLLATALLSALTAWTAPAPFPRPTDPVEQNRLNLKKYHAAFRESKDVTVTFFVHPGEPFVLPLHGKQDFRVKVGGEGTTGDVQATATYPNGFIRVVCHGEGRAVRTVSFDFGPDAKKPFKVVIRYVTTTRARRTSLQP